MALDQKDIEIIGRLIYKNTDDIAVTVSRALGRLEEKMDAVESRLRVRIADTENNMEAVRVDLSDGITNIKSLILELSRLVGECARGQHK